MTSAIKSPSRSPTGALRHRTFASIVWRESGTGDPPVKKDPAHKMRLAKEFVMIKYPVGPETCRSPLPFSPATQVGNLLFVSGQASTDENGNIVQDTFEAELRRTMEHL